MAETLERRLGVFSATTLIVGSMIGSGIFIAPSIMAGLDRHARHLPRAVAHRWRADAARRARLRRAVRDDAEGRRTVRVLARSVRPARRLPVRLDASSSSFRAGSTRRSRSPSRSSSAASGCTSAKADIIFKLGFFTLSRAQLVAVVIIACPDVGQLPRRRGGRVRAEPVHRAQGGRDRAARRHRLLRGKGSFANFHPLVGAQLGSAAVGMTLARRRRRRHVEGAVRLRRVEHGHLRRRGDPRAAAQPAARAGARQHRHHARLHRRLRRLPLRPAAAGDGARSPRTASPPTWPACCSAASA